MSVCLSVCLSGVLVQSVPPKPPLSLLFQDGTYRKKMANFAQKCAKTRQSWRFSENIADFQRKKDRFSCIKNENF